MKEINVQTIIEKFLISEFYLQNEYSKIPINLELYQLGIDSFDFFKIINFVEEKFNIKVEKEELREENFINIESITEYLYTKGVIKIGIDD